MSTPLHDLQRLVVSRKSISGRVVAVTGGMVHVATAQGVLETPGDGLTVGDRVIIQDGKAVKRQNQQGVSSYFV